jgi:3-oxoadipate enol-lactonase
VKAGLVNGPAGPVHWIRDGHGPPLVLLHGLGGDVEFWTAEISALHHAFDVIAIDLRGSGDTPATNGGHTIDDLADDLAAVLDGLSLGSAHIVGFSMGGNVAQAFATRYPERVDRLVLASTFAVMNAQARGFLDAVLDVYATGATSKQMFDLICPWLFSLSFLTDPANGDYFKYPEGGQEEEQSMDAWRQLYLAQRAFDARDRLASVVADTLVLVGEHDSLVSIDDARELIDGIPSADLDVITGAGHLINIEAPKQFITAIYHHLGAHPAN